MSNSAQSLAKRLTCILLSGAIALSLVPSPALAEALKETEELVNEGEDTWGDEPADGGLLAVEEPAINGEADDSSDMEAEFHDEAAADVPSGEKESPAESDDSESWEGEELEGESVAEAQDGFDLDLVEAVRGCADVIMLAAEGRKDLVAEDESVGLVVTLYDALFANLVTRDPAEGEADQGGEFAIELRDSWDAAEAYRQLVGESVEDAYGFEALRALLFERLDGEGVADAFVRVARDLGVECVAVQGDDGSAWAMMQLGEAWYHVDVVSALREEQATAESDEQLEEGWQRDIARKWLLVSDDTMLEQKPECHGWVVREDGAEVPESPESYQLTQGAENTEAAEAKGEKNGNESVLEELSDEDALKGQAYVLWSRKCGTVTYTIYTDGLLEIGKKGESGTLASNDNPTAGSYDSFFPWLIGKNEVTRVKVLPGVKAGRSIDNMFYGMNRVTSIDLSGLDTSATTSMHGMFNGCSSLSSINLTGLNLSRVIDMSSMFNGCTSLKSINLSGINATSLENTQRMFGNAGYHAGSISINLKGFKAPRIKIVGAMFWNCPVKTVDVSGFGTSRATDISYWFNGAWGLQSIDLSGLDTSNVTKMRLLFADCSSLKSVNLSGLDTSKVEDFREMFWNCKSLESLDLSSFDMSRAQNTQNMFEGINDGKQFVSCESLKYFKIGKNYRTDLDGAVPSATASNGKWFSAKARTWFTPAQIAASRSGIADTYTNYSYSRFPDVPDSHWAHNVVDRAVDLNLMHGYDNGNFGPEDSITRGQVAVVLWNMAGNPSAQSGAKSFPDVSSGAYYYKAVRWASSIGVVSGYANGRFGPNDKVTREQLAVMIANYARKVKGLDVSGSASDYASMSDGSSVSSYAQMSVGWCFKNGIMSGSNGKILPKGNATRAQAAKMFVRLYDLKGAVAKKSISGATVTLSQTSYTYDGSAKKPGVTVVLEGKTLKKDTDYSVSYKNNVNVGTATVTVTGKGNYTGSVSKTFKISQAPATPKSIANATVTLSSASYTYDGSAKKPGVTVVLEGKTLSLGTDYSVSYSNNVNAGTATVTVTGKGNYTGTVSRTFKIAQASLSGATVTLGQTHYVYDGSTKEPGVSVSLSGKTLYEGSDYWVRYDENTVPGTATVNVFGQGNYTGSASAIFTIKDALSITCDNGNAVSFGTLQLHARAAYSGTAVSGVRWSSSDSSVATVDANGKVAGKSLKLCPVTITATTSNGATGCYVVFMGAVADSEWLCGSVWHLELFEPGTSSVIATKDLKIERGSNSWMLIPLSSVFSGYTGRYELGYRLASGVTGQVCYTSDNLTEKPIVEL